MITPWSTNAVEITRSMGIKCINRIEVFICHEISDKFDKMIHEEYKALNQNIFDNYTTPEKIYLIDNLKKYNDDQGLALDDFEILIHLLFLVEIE
jgi:phosphoribosylformylglycinamidine synthase